jgi:hypothetical protein
MFKFAVPLLALPALIGLSLPAQGANAAWQRGYVFAGVGQGTYKVYDNNGNFIEQISSGDTGRNTTGCAFDSSNNLYTTEFQSRRMVKYDFNHPHNVLQVIDIGALGGAGTESIVFDAAGNFYVGNADGDRDIKMFNAAGTFVRTFNVLTGPRGTDWIDLARDQRTMFYTSEGGVVRRYDIVADAQLGDFASLAVQPMYAMRLLPPFDGTGGLIVANTTDIKRLDGAGAVAQTYDAAGENLWFAMNLDPNGTSFWSGDLNSGNFYRFNIASGAIEVGPIASGGPFELAGLCVLGEITGGTERIDLEPKTAENQIGTTHTVTATVSLGGNGLPGILVDFKIVSGPHAGQMGSDTTDANGEATFTWLGTAVGTDVIEACFTARDGSRKCDIARKTWLGECFQFIGFNKTQIPLPWSPSDTLYVIPIVVFRIAMDDIPRIPIPTNPNLVGLHVYNQVYLGNPIDYPSDPYKVSEGLDVVIGGSASYYGTPSGMGIWLAEPPVPGGNLRINFSIR